MKTSELGAGGTGAARPLEQGGPAPSGGTRIFFELRTAELEIYVRDDVRHVLKEIRLREVMDREHHDLAVDLYVNGEFMLRVAEGPETPWFFDDGELEDTIRRHGELWTYKEILGWFKHPIDELEEEV